MAVTFSFQQAFSAGLDQPRRKSAGSHKASPRCTRRAPGQAQIWANALAQSGFTHGLTSAAAMDRTGAEMAALSAVQIGF